MNNPIEIVRLLKGMVQGEQVPEALQPTSFQVDERDTKKLLSHVSAVASVLDYVDLQGKKDGSWSTLMLSDVTVLTARMAQYNGTEKYNQFLGFQKAIEQGLSIVDQQAFIQNFFRLGFEAIFQVNEWYQLSSQNFFDSGITKYLRQEIDAKGINLLASFYNVYFAETETNPAFRNECLDSFAKLDKHWSFNPFPNGVRKTSFTEASRYGQLIFNWLDEIVAKAEEEFEQSLLRNDIPPHVGLLLAFIDLFKYEQAAINTITERHLDFYYQRILQAKEKQAQPDKAIVTMGLANGTDRLLIPRGTPLEAGMDDSGKSILFETQDDVEVTKSQIVDYLTLTFPSSTRGYNDITSGALQKFGNLNNASWPLFGLTESSENIRTKPARVGLAISSPDLLLTQSARQITITMGVDTSDENIFNDFPTDQVFEIQLTSGKGWVTAGVDKVIYNNAEKNFVIGFSLSPADPAVVPYMEKVHGAGFETNWPICKIELSDSGRSSYEKFKSLAIHSLIIAATVKGLSDFLVENDSGKLSPYSPFSPFNMPSVGSSLYIGGQELFVKQLKKIALTITWDKLPKSFKEYYEAYNDYFGLSIGPLKIPHTPVFQNQAFSATTSVLMNGEWMPAINMSAEKPSATCTLFTDETNIFFAEHDMVKAGKKKIVLTNAMVAGNPTALPFNSSLPAINSLNNTLREGFISLTLSAPSRGFGFADYPIIVSDVTLANSEIIMKNASLLASILKSKKAKTKALPNIPYVPKIKTLEVDYNSLQQYDFMLSSSLKCYHLHPFGVEKISFSSNAVSFLPEYSCASYNYFSFQSLLQNTDLSFCFVLENRVKSIGNENKTDIIYEYLTEKGWRPLQVLSDTTNGFQCTGIIRFTVPNDASQENAEMPSHLYWYRIGKKNPSDIKISFVATQALWVHSRPTSNTKRTQIPAGTITKFAGSMPGVKNIMQPAPSSGAVPPQTENEFRCTVAGRIRHKKRIVSALDIEHAVLDAFPEFFKITAIPLAYSDPERVGVIKIIITPCKNRMDDNAYVPLATIQHMENVLNFLLDLGMPSITYEISNPTCYKLKVTSNVMFREANQLAELTKKLNDDINSFLSPWIQDNPDRGILFTSSASTNQLYRFVKSLPYVHHITDFSVALDDPKVTIDDVGPDGLIVPASYHNINVVETSQYKNEDDSGIRIGKNFYVTV